MNDTLVSVIITTHNRSPNIVVRAVNSALKQTYKNIEIIVVDDSNKDYSLRRKVEREIRQLSDRIHYIKHIDCKGACAARNTGLSYANGYYVAFLDDDDEWLPTKIEEQLLGFVDSSVALVYCGTIIVDEIRNKRYVRSIEYKAGNVFSDLLVGINFIGGTSNPLIKRNCIDEVGGFDAEMQSLQDYDLWLRITIRYPVNYIRKPLLRYYIHSEADQILTDIDKQIAGQKRINFKYNKYLKNNHTWFLRYRYLVPLYVEKGMRHEAFQIWRKCVQKSPLSIPQNVRQLFLIIFGYNRFIIGGYLSIIHFFTHHGSC